MNFGEYAPSLFIFSFFSEGIFKNDYILFMLIILRIFTPRC